MPSLKRISLILAKIEDISGVDANPTPEENAILVSSPDIKVNGETLERDFDRLSLSPLEHIIGAKDNEFSFESELKGSGSANKGGMDDVPEIHPLLIGCGMGAKLTPESKSGDGDGDISYLPASLGHQTLTIYYYTGEHLFKALGCMGSFKIVADTGKFPKVEWTFKGTFEQVRDVSIPKTGVYSPEKAAPFVGANLSIGGYRAIVAALSLDIANDIERRVDANALEGVLGFLITRRDTQGTLDPEMVPEATHPFWEQWEKGIAAKLTVSVGKVEGSQIEITAPKVQAKEISMGDRAGLRTYQMNLRLAMDAGDDELKLKFK